MKYFIPPISDKGVAIKDVILIRLMIAWTAKVLED